MAAPNKKFFKSTKKEEDDDEIIQEEQPEIDVEVLEKVDEIILDIKNEYTEDEMNNASFDLAEKVIKSKETDIKKELNKNITPNPKKDVSTLLGALNVLNKKKAVTKEKKSEDLNNDEQLRKELPANVEGSKEFNKANEEIEQGESNPLLIKGHENFHYSQEQRDTVIRKAEKYFGQYLTALGYDWENDPNMRDTPHRVTKAYVNELMIGNFSEIPKVTSFTDNEDEDLVYDGIVLQKVKFDHKGKFKIIETLLEMKTFKQKEISLKVTL